MTILKNKEMEEQTCDIFEVFKTKSVPRSQITSLEFAELRRKYVILKAIEKQVVLILCRKEAGV